MRNKDVIFASNATSVEATKFMTYLRMIIGTVSDPIAASIAAYTLKGLASGGISSAATIVTTR
jgi:polysaccharide export outer membrane protein